MLRGFGVLLVTLGMVLLLGAYWVWVDTERRESAQRELSREFDRVQAQDRRPPLRGVQRPAPRELGRPLPGGAVARLHIPRLRLQWVVVEGVSPADLKGAPGHYPGTAMPGEIGNFAVAGHRSPGFFWDLDRVKPGDAIVAEDRFDWYVYRVTRNKIVSPRAVEVVAPVPGRPEAVPTTAMLTLTTCNPKWDNYERLIVHAEFLRQDRKTEGRPAELG